MFRPWQVGSRVSRNFYNGQLAVVEAIYGYLKDILSSFQVVNLAIDTSKAHSKVSCIGDARRSPVDEEDEESLCSFGIT